VPNFSEGRDAATLEALAGVLSARAQLLDIHADTDHNRSVFTLVADDDDLVEALAAAVACALPCLPQTGHPGQIHRPQPPARRA